jgi:RNA polymerase sigma-70 factor (ECF subfamily)
MSQISQQQWSELMDQVATHQDTQAFSLIFKHFSPRVKSFLLAAGLSAEDAEECAQQTLISVWEKSQSYNPKAAALSTWIYTIARNKKIDHFRKIQRQTIEPEFFETAPTSEDSAEVQTLQQEEHTQLYSFIEQLPPLQKEVIQKAYLDEKTHTEISEETGLPLGTIKSRLRLGLEKLKHLETLQQ